MEAYAENTDDGEGISLAENILMMMMTTTTTTVVLFSSSFFEEAGFCRLLLKDFDPTNGLPYGHCSVGEWLQSSASPINWSFFLTE